MNTTSPAPTAAATSARSPRLTSRTANRVVTINVGLLKIANAVATPARLPQPGPRRVRLSGLQPEALPCAAGIGACGAEAKRGRRRV